MKSEEIFKNFLSEGGKGASSKADKAYWDKLSEEEKERCRKSYIKGMIFAKDYIEGYIKALSCFED